jgi:hypothetical protein
MGWLQQRVYSGGGVFERQIMQGQSIFPLVLSSSILKGFPNIFPFFPACSDSLIFSRVFPMPLGSK